jgi:dihydroxyacid dehydratase/phosphogluconate dehydratase
MAVVELRKESRRARSEAFENAIAVTMAFGASTSRAASAGDRQQGEVDLDLDDFVAHRAQGAPPG